MTADLLRISTSYEENRSACEWHCRRLGRRTNHFFKIRELQSNGGVTLRRLQFREPSPRGLRMPVARFQCKSGHYQILLTTLEFADMTRGLVIVTSAVPPPPMRLDCLRALLLQASHTYPISGASAAAF